MTLLCAAACAMSVPPRFPETTNTPLVGPHCGRPERPCRCSSTDTDAGDPPEGRRRFEIRLPNTQGTASAVEIDGIGTVVRDESDPGGSCFYLDLRPGATYRFRYLAQAASRERGISVAFTIREARREGGWYDVLTQRCGSSDRSCQYESVSDWISAVEGGHRFHDPCGSTDLANMRVDGGLYDRRFTDAQFAFDLVVGSEPPLGRPGGACLGRK